jgi:hypothetical protein
MKFASGSGYLHNPLAPRMKRLQVGDVKLDGMNGGAAGVERGVAFQ